MKAPPAGYVEERRRSLEVACVDGQLDREPQRVIRRLRRRRRPANLRADLAALCILFRDFSGRFILAQLEAA